MIPTAPPPAVPSEVSESPRLRWLKILSALYLALPYVLFFWGWLRWEVAAIATTLLLWLLRGEIRPPGEGLVRGLAPLFRQWQWTAAVLLTVLWLSFSGIGGYGFEVFDHLKSGAVLNDLVHGPWPTRYHDGGREHTLVYYLAYWLPAAWVGSHWGWAAANHALWLWSLGGTLLALGWFAWLTGMGRRPVAALAVFAFVSGADYLGRAFVSGALPELAQTQEYWNSFWRYISATNGLYWAPHQTLAAWLVTGWWFSELRSPRPYRSLPLLLSLSVLWSPWITLGLIPLGVWLLWERGEPETLVRNSAWIPAAGTAAVLGLYYLSSRFTLPVGWVGTFAPQFDPNHRFTPALMAVTYLVEVGMPVLLTLPAFLAAPRAHRKLAVVLGVTLVGVPWFQMGHYHDFGMRVSFPALFALWVLVGRSLAALPRAFALRLGWAAVFVACALSPVGDIAKSATSRRSFHTLPPRRTLPEIHLAEQYYGRSETLFFRYLARPSGALSVKI